MHNAELKKGLVEGIKKQLGLALGKRLDMRTV
jgi:hypothetical protein